MSFSRICGVFFRYFLVVKKGPQQLSDIFYWPFVDILLWGLTSMWLQTHQTVHNLPLILMTALIFWQVAWRGSIDVSVSLLNEFWHRNLVNLFSTPLKISEWCTGIILLSLCKLMVSLSFGCAVVYILYALNVFTIGWAFLPFAALLLMFGWSLSFFAAGVIIRWGHQAEMIAWMIAFLFAPFSAVFYPASILPWWAQKISWCLPTTYVFEGMRMILSQGTFPIAFFGYSLVLNIIYLALSVLFFKWMFKKSLIKGLARLE